MVVFIVWIVFNCFLESHKKVCNHVINVIMPSEDTKIDGCKSNPEKSYTTKANEHIPTGFIMSAILSFNPLTYIISSYLKLGKFNMVTIFSLTRTV